jgi:hypothetical protein
MRLTVGEIVIAPVSPVKGDSCWQSTELELAPVILSELLLTSSPHHSYKRLTKL